MGATEDCKYEAGVFIPVINRNSCEGKKACEAVCPYGVFAIGTLPQDQRVGLSFSGKIKGYVHRWQQALLVNADACHGCGLCVKACPESAITLTRT